MQDAGHLAVGSLFCKPYKRISLLICTGPSAIRCRKSRAGTTACSSIPPTKRVRTTARSGKRCVAVNSRHGSSSAWAKGWQGRLDQGGLLPDFGPQRRVAESGQIGHRHQWADGGREPSENTDRPRISTEEKAKGGANVIISALQDLRAAALESVIGNLTSIDGCIATIRAAGSAATDAPRILVQCPAIARIGSWV